MLIQGQSPLCPTCRGAMNRARQEGGASISQSGHKALGQPMEARYFRDESLNGEGVIFQGQTPDDRLEIQRSLTVDQQDVDLELDDYCIITGAGATNYGGIRSCVVGDETVTLELTSAAA